MMVERKAYVRLLDILSKAANGKASVIL